MGNRVSAEVELEGLDIPEMGALAYPDFVLGPGVPDGERGDGVSHEGREDRAGLTPCAWIPLRSERRMRRRVDVMKLPVSIVPAHR